MIHEENMRNQIADLIVDVLSGRTTSIEAGLWMKVVDEPEDIGLALHAIDHYLVDSDIRARDNRYQLLQEAQLRAIADSLRLGIPLTDSERRFLSSRPTTVFKALCGLRLRLAKFARRPQTPRDRAR